MVALEPRQTNGSAQPIDQKVDIANAIADLNARNLRTGPPGTNPFPPVVLAGSIDASGTFQGGAVGLTARSVPQTDLAQSFNLLMDHSRKLSVKDSRWWDWVPEGRTVFEDKFANTISWVQATGTVAYSTVRPYPGNVNCMRMTTGAGAGNQAVATLGVFRLADAQSRGLDGFLPLPGDGPKIWYGLLFKNTDVNLGFIEIGVQCLDGTSQTVCRLRLTYPSGQLSVFNLGGTYTNIGTPVALSTSERWHWLAMEIHYQSGVSTAAGPNIFYVRARIDDTAVDFTPYIPGNTIGGAVVSESVLEITVQNNAAVVEICDIGYVVVKDLTNVRGLLG